MDLTKQIQIAVARADIALCASMSYLQRAIPATIVLVIAIIIMVRLCKKG